MRLICAVIALVTGATVLTADDSAEKLAALKKKYDRQLDELKKQFENAETAAEKDGIRVAP